MSIRTGTFLFALGLGAMLSETSSAESVAPVRTKIEAALMEAMAGKDSSDTIRIAIWLVPHRDASHLMRELREPAGRASTEILAEARTLIAETQAPVVNFLAARGYQPSYASQYTPLLFAAPSKAAILNLAQRWDVDALYLSRTYGPLINHAAKSVRADVVWARGINGAGVQIAVVESGRIEFGNPYLTAGAAHLPGGPIDDHPTGIAGIIAANSTKLSERWTGVAWGAPALLSGNSDGWDDHDLVAATDWAITNGATIINKSYGIDSDLGLQALDRYCDYLVRYYYKTIVVAAGNDAGGWGTGTDNVGSPGLAYNVITVGSFVDQNTFNWSGPVPDAISDFSSFNDPRAVITNILFNGNSTALTDTVLTDAGANFGAANGLAGRYLNPNTVHQTSFLITANTATTITVSMVGWLTTWAAAGDPYQVQEETSGDREKPEVLACGDGDPADGANDIVSTAEVAAAGGPAPWIKNITDGTSFAAPQVVGEAALMIERDNNAGGSLVVWPEAIKAIIMASACHEFEAALPGEKSGAGGIVACEADEIVKNQRYHHQFVTSSDFAGGPWTKSIDLKADRKTRVVLCWDANPVRNVITGTSTGLTATTLTDATAPFGPANSKVGWILNPDDTQEVRYFSVVSNTATVLTVSAGSDMTTVAAIGDTYRLVSYPTESLDADLDLYVWDPVAGVDLASSARWENNYEIVEFVPPRTDTYEIQVEDFRFDGTIEPIGVAWTQEPCCSPDWGDAPDDMTPCPTRPHKGDFPTRKSSTGASVREFEVEWLSKDNTVTPGATWEMDAWVPHYRVEKDQDGEHNIVLPPGPDPLCDPALDGPCCTADQDGEDDGVFPDPIYLAGTKGRVTFYVNSATPDLGRYSSAENDEKIYVWGWFDWEHDDSDWDGNLMVKWRGGPTMVGEALVGDCIEGCRDPQDLWDSGDHQMKVVFEFDVPAFLPEGPFWIRFRASYGEEQALNYADPQTLIAGEPDSGETTYGEVEDHISYQAQPIELDYFPYSVAQISINSPLGSDTVTLTGPTTVEVNLGSLGDVDSNGLEEVPTEMVQLELTGNSTLFGPVTVRLRPDTSAPFMLSTGQIEENANNTPGLLDIRPFASTGSASSSFDLYFEIEVAGELFHNNSPKHLETQITYKPPAVGETYESPEWIPLYDESNTYAGVDIGAVFHTPNTPGPVPTGGIPTVSEWGLMIMTGLVLATGVIVLGRRRRSAAG